MTLSNNKVIVTKEEYAALMAVRDMMQDFFLDIDDGGYVEEVSHNIFDGICELSLFMEKEG